MRAHHGIGAVDLLARAPREPDQLLAFVDRHQIAGLAAACVRPGLVSAALRARQKSSAMRALRHAAATVRAIRSLRAQEIDAIPLKGAILADQLYGDASIRDVRDADLLIRPEHLLLADVTLRENGYERVWPKRVPPPNSHGYRLLIRDGYHFEYTHVSEQVNLELHWRLPSWSPDAVETLWDSSQTRLWQGTPVRTLTDDALLLLLCDHGARHRWFRLKWLVDVAALLPHVEDTAHLLRLARRLDLERPLAQAVLLCDRVFATPAAVPLQAITGTHECRWLADQALRAIEAPAAEYFTAVRSIPRLLRLRLYERRLRTRQVRWRISARLGDIIDLPLPDPWFWLYLPLRPLLWLRRLLA